MEHWINLLLICVGLFGLGVTVSMLVSRMRSPRGETSKDAARQAALARLIDRIMPSVWFVYLLWFAGNCIMTFHAAEASIEIVVGLWSAFGGSVATFALTLAKQRGAED